VVFSIEPKIINPPKNRHDYQLSEVIRYRAWVEIDRYALQQNVRKVKALLAPKTELMAVIKADAYGHGAVKVANSVLEAGAQSLAIATIGEGIELREAGIVAPIMILGAVNTPEEVAALAHWQLQPTLVQIEQVRIFAAVMRRLEQRLPVHIKLDTGMSRLGTQWQNGTKFVEQVLEAPNLKIASIYSHFATADDPNPEIMQLQRQRFQQAIAELRAKGYHPPCLHLANSAATLSDRSLHYDRVRVGLALYGLYPADHLTDKVPLQLVPASKSTHCPSQNHCRRLGSELWSSVHSGKGHPYCCGRYRLRRWNSPQSLQSFKSIPERTFSTPNRRHNHGSVND
jgi:alanine racemase